MKLLKIFKDFSQIFAVNELCGNLYKTFFRPCKYSYIYYILFVKPYQVCMTVFINATCISQVYTVSYPRNFWVYTSCVVFFQVHGIWKSENFIKVLLSKAGVYLCMEGDFQEMKWIVLKLAYREQREFQEIFLFSRLIIKHLFRRGTEWSLSGLVSYFGSF